ncbi:MAG: hypothetical protein MZV63_50440 [Marinilabiliales bacterium]|nr:hypothetical protein [Marinilabiliales bacterium]
MRAAAKEATPDRALRWKRKKISHAEMARLAIEVTSGIRLYSLCEQR